MKKIIPVLTEKSLKDAEKGNYTFLVDPMLNKTKIRRLVSEMFDVEVADVRTMNKKGEIKRTLMGRNKVMQPKKKAIVSLKGKDKIDIFEEVK